MSDGDELIIDHPYEGDPALGSGCLHMYVSGYERGLHGTPRFREEQCYRLPSQHANPGEGSTEAHLIHTDPHEYVASFDVAGDHCAYVRYGETDESHRVCGYPRTAHEGLRRRLPVRVADTQQYPREPMPDAARGRISVTLIDAPVDPLGTLACIRGIYSGSVRRGKAEVTDEQRREAWDGMRKTVLSGPLEAMQFTFLIEGVDRALTHQLVRSRFSFVAQESLRFAVAEDWAAEVALPPSLMGRKEDDPLVAMWRAGLNTAEDRYAALVAAGMPAEEARGLLPHAIPTRLFWTLSLRTLLMEAGKRTCTQAQFPWRILFAGISAALRDRGGEGETYYKPSLYKRLGTTMSRVPGDGWQYRLFAEAIEPVCYQTGRCGFKAEFDRACSIRERVDAFERIGVDSSDWGHPNVGAIDQSLRPIDPREWMADPSAARLSGQKRPATDEEVKDWLG